MDAVVSWPRSAQLLVSGTILAGAATAAGWLSDVPAWTRGDIAALLLLAAAIAVGELFQFELPYRTERTTYSVSDALWTAALFLVRPGVLTMAVVVGVVVGQALQTWALIKVAFNAAQFVIGITVALAVYHALGAPAVTDPTGWLAAALAMAAFQVVNTFLTASVISLIEREPLRQAALVPTGMLHWVGNVATGVLAALLWTLAPLGLPLLLVPLTFTFLAYRGWLSSIAERSAMRDIARTAEVVCRSGDMTARLSVPNGREDARQLAATLNLMLDRLEAAFQRERLFIREASHELRTPITICHGHLEVLGTDPTPEELAETVSLVLDELRRMGRIVEDMNMLARVEDPRSLRCENVRLDRLVSDVAAKASPLLDQQPQVSLDSPAAMIHADPQRLTQALINLLANARQHTPAGTRIELRAVAERDDWRFEVSDQGDGLDPAYEAAVFRPFCTADTRSPGNGLGLAIVAGIARAHGGQVGVDNHPGQGATFWLRVPR